MYVEVNKEFVQCFAEDYCKDKIIPQELSIVYVCSDFWKRILPNCCLCLPLSYNCYVYGLFSRERTSDTKYIWPQPQFGLVLSKPWGILLLLSEK